MAASAYSNDGWSGLARIPAAGGVRLARPAAFSTARLDRRRL